MSWSIEVLYYVFLKAIDISMETMNKKKKNENR